jgi:hypothetical protein
MMNTTHFMVLAGDPASWDEETRRLCRSGIYENTYNSEDLCKVQVDQFFRGRRSATIVETIYGWSVRSDSNLDNRAIYLSRVTKEAAIKFGIAWANEDPKNREFYVSRQHV